MSFRARLQLAENRSHENLGHTVRVGVGSGTTVLKVAKALGGSFAGDADGAATVGDTVGELLDGARLVAAGEALLVVLAVLLNALLVVGLEVLEGRLDVSHATLDTHLLGGDVGVHAGAVPGTLDGLGVQGDLDAKVLGDAGEEEARDPELITHGDALAGADLELPLGGHDLGVGAGDEKAGVEAGLVVSLDNIAHNDLGGADTAVVRTLGRGETADGPAERTVVEVEHGVLLLETEPGLVLGVGLHHLGALVAVVELVGGAIGVPALGENNDVGAATEGIRVDGAGTEVDVRVLAGGLVGGGAVKVPNGEIFGLVAAFDLFQSLKMTTLVSGPFLEEKLGCMVWWNG